MWLIFLKSDWFNFRKNDFWYFSQSSCWIFCSFFSLKREIFLLGKEREGSGKRALLFSFSNHFFRAKLVGKFSEVSSFYALKILIVKRIISMRGREGPKGNFLKGSLRRYFKGPYWKISSKGPLIIQNYYYNHLELTTLLSYFSLFL